MRKLLAITLIAAVASLAIGVAGTRGASARGFLSIDTTVGSPLHHFVISGEGWVSDETLHVHFMDPNNNRYDLDDDRVYVRDDGSFDAGFTPINLFGGDASCGTWTAYFNTERGTHASIDFTVAC